MQLRSYADDVHSGLLAAAEASGEEARALAERLFAPLDAAIRLTLLEALSAAADEITRELAPGSVEVRLRGGEPSFAVTPPPAEEAGEAGDTSFKASLIRMGEVMMGVRPPATGAPPDADESATARINFRPPERLKARIEYAAGRDGMSVNAWLVRAVTAALELDAGAPAHNDEPPGRRSAGWRAPRGGQRYTGWAR